MTRQTAEQHEGKKYLREIHDAVESTSVDVDVYAVLVAFDVTCPARAHAIKKLLCAGQRGKGSATADLIGAMAALNRAIDLQARRDEDEPASRNPQIIPVGQEPPPMEPKP